MYRFPVDKSVVKNKKRKILRRVPKEMTKRKVHCAIGQISIMWLIAKIIEHGIDIFGILSVSLKLLEKYEKSQT